RLPVTTAKVVCLDDEWEEILSCSQMNPERRSGPENLMYVIHTSGSTGIPSGVMIEQKSKLNHLHAIISQSSFLGPVGSGTLPNPEGFPGNFDNDPQHSWT
ncbi:MAG: AMP-binding protein, partial [Planctomycetes bacterium]|nr:AMP-binding protein [Planctomycetota bacterium]